MALPVVVSQILNGVAFGMLLFLLAAGLSLMFGLMGVVNLAHGAYFMVGGYVGLTVLEATGSFLLAIVAGSLAGALLGFLTERFLMRRLYGLRGHESILLTFALSLMLGDMSLFLWTGTPRWVQTAGVSPVLLLPPGKPLSRISCSHHRHRHLHIRGPLLVPGAHPVGGHGAGGGR